MLPTLNQSATISALTETQTASGAKTYTSETLSTARCSIQPRSAEEAADFGVETGTLAAVGYLSTVSESGTALVIKHNYRLSVVDPSGATVTYQVKGPPVDMAGKGIIFKVNLQVLG